MQMRHIMGYMYKGTTIIKVCGVNACGEGVWLDDFVVLVQNCTGISDGIYYLKIEGNTINLTKKIVIKK